MRRFVLTAVLLLSGCSGSGFWTYEKDGFAFPWENPNEPVSAAANFERARHGVKDTATPQLLSEAGDIWPGPPQPLPTMKELQKQQMAEINNDSSGDSAGLTALPTLPALPGFELSQQQVQRPAPANLFNDGAATLAGGRRASSKYNVLTPTPDAATKQSTGSTKTPPDNGNIIVPNGNGTSTVISPTGTVSTIPSQK
jgi:hypothetical protein